MELIKLKITLQHKETGEECEFDAGFNPDYVIMVTSDPMFPKRARIFTTNGGINLANHTVEELLKKFDVKKNVGNK